MYKTAEELRAKLPSEQLVVPLSQGDILDACPLVFWADQTREVTEGDKPQSVKARAANWRRIGVSRLCRLAAPGMMKMELDFGSLWLEAGVG